PYLVLEYVYGDGLYRWAWLRNPSARQVSGLLLQVAEALEAAHAVGVLHRDFKGSNLVVRPDGQVVVLDWGAGLHPEAVALTCTARMPPGTPMYYSPQVLRWRTLALRGGGGRYPYTLADECYAVGVTFYRLLADEYPPLQLAGREDEVGLEALVPRPLALLNPRVPEALAALVMWLLEPRPEARLGRMAALASEVRRVLEDAGEAWDRPLFEWYAGPGSQSRTTNEDGGWGPVALGDEAALLKDRWRRPEVQADRAAERWLRRRHPQAWAAPEAGVAEPAPAGAGNLPEASPLPAEAGARRPEAVSPEASQPGKAAAHIPAPAEKAASAEAARLVEPVTPGAVPTRPGHRVRRGVAVVALLAAVLLAGALVLERTRPLVASGGEETVGPKMAPAPGLRHSAEAGAALASPPQLPPQESLMSTPSASRTSAPGLVSTLKRGAVACGAAATLACSGSQIRPTPGAPCPDGALEAMQKLGMTQGMQVDIYTRHDRPGGANEALFVRDGEIVSRVFASYNLPHGTLVEGRLWTQGKTVIGRYTAMELPNGRRYPVCLVLCDYDGCPKYSESTPEAAAIGHANFFTVVDFFP
ncbi:MAG TPA: hypothetical protein VE153_28075, partial [Myxococcus sp.]|nr:hypothetical protein [Myxococcus sp.]